MGRRIVAFQAWFYLLVIVPSLLRWVTLEKHLQRKDLAITRTLLHIYQNQSSPIHPHLLPLYRKVLVYHYPLFPCQDNIVLCLNQMELSQTSVYLAYHMDLVCLHQQPMVTAGLHPCMMDLSILLALVSIQSSRSCHFLGKSPVWKEEELLIGCTLGLIPGRLVELRQYLEDDLAAWSQVDFSERWLLVETTKAHPNIVDLSA